MSDFEEIDKAAKALEAAKKKREQAQHQVIREVFHLCRLPDDP